MTEFIVNYDKPAHILIRVCSYMEYELIEISTFRVI